MTEDDQLPRGQGEAGKPVSAETRKARRQRARRKTIWRRLRRTTFALALLAILVPVAAFIICYQLWDVPDPAQIAAEQGQTITLYYADGRTELTRILPQGGARTHVTIADLPPHVQNAVLAAEDNTFWTNDGFDVTGLARATWNNITGASGGGSTITQQYVKKATGKEDYSLSRKFRELVLAKKMSDTYRKEDILTAYLNTVYFGRGANGIQAAAKAYFGKDVRTLDVSEAALLAGVIQRPTYWDPEVDRDNAERRWRFVLDQMVGQNWLSAADREGARFPTTLPRDADTTRSGPLQHIQYQVLAELEERAGIGRDEAHQRGYRIVTTIDRHAQEAAENAMRDVMKGQHDYLRSALVSVDPKTGGVAAYFGGEKPNSLDYAQSLQEPGTAFSPFVAVAAVANGIDMDQRLNGDSPRTIGGIPMKNPPAVDCSPCTVRQALQQPVHTAIAELAVRVGTVKVADAAHRAGIPPTVRDRPTMTDSPGKEPDARIAIGMGNTQVRPLDLAAAYATLAADGVRTSPHFVDRVENASEDVFYQFIPSEEAAFDAEDAERNARVARSVTEALVTGSDGRRPRSGRWTAMKAGERGIGDSGQTAKAWMIGYTPELATAVWFGADRIQPIRGRYGESNGKEHDITGRDEPAVVWKAVTIAHQKKHAPHPAEPVPMRIDMPQIDGSPRTAVLPAPPQTEPLSSRGASGASTSTTGVS